MDYEGDFYDTSSERVPCTWFLAFIGIIFIILMGIQTESAFRFTFLAFALPYGTAALWTTSVLSVLLCGTHFLISDDQVGKMERVMFLSSIFIAGLSLTSVYRPSLMEFSLPANILLCGAILYLIPVALRA